MRQKKHLYSIVLTLVFLMSLVSNSYSCYCQNDSIEQSSSQNDQPKCHVQQTKVLDCHNTNPYSEGINNVNSCECKFLDKSTQSTIIEEFNSTSRTNYHNSFYEYVEFYYSHNKPSCPIKTPIHIKSEPIYIHTLHIIV